MPAGWSDPALGESRPRRAVKAAEIQTAYRSALDAVLGDLGFERTREAYVLSVPPGGVELLVGMPFTYGRVSTFVNLAVRHDHYERCLRSVLGDLSKDLADHTVLVPMRDLARGQGLDLEVEDTGDVAAAAGTIGAVWVDVLAPFLETVRPLDAICRRYEYMDTEKVPLALRLLGEVDELEAWLDDWDVGPDPRLRTFGHVYRDRLPDVERL